MSWLRAASVCAIWGIILACHSTTHGQDDYVHSLIQSLDKANILRNALERGDRGDGVHYRWMDDMRKLGIKQVSFNIDFEWRDYKVVCSSMKTIDYHPTYYNYSQVIRDPDILGRIHGSEFEKSVREEGMKRARELLDKILNGKPTATGTVYINLLDDERLPVLYDIPDIEIAASPN